MINWIFELCRDYYWLLYTNWKSGGDKWKKRYAFFAMTSFLPTPFAIPMLGLIHLLHPFELGRELTVYSIVLLIVVLGVTLTYFICTKDKAYLGAKNRAEGLAGKPLKRYQTKIMYKFMALLLFLITSLGVPALYLM